MTHGYEVKELKPGWWYVVRTTQWRNGEIFAGPYATKERAERRVPRVRA